MTQQGCDASFPSSLFPSSCSPIQSCLFGSMRFFLATTASTIRNSGTSRHWGRFTNASFSTVPWFDDESSPPRYQSLHHGKWTSSSHTHPHKVHNRLDRRSTTMCTRDSQEQVSEHSCRVDISPSTSQGPAFIIFSQRKRTFYPSKAC